MKHSFITFFIGSIVVMGFVMQSEPKKNIAKQNIVPNTLNIIQKPEVPVLSYHRIRNILASDSKNMKTYSVTPTHFGQQMKTLYDNGFNTILPDQLYEYIMHDGKLPSKPILITFDDGREEQYRLGLTEMNKYGFKGVFFIMTVSINRPGYMTKTQIKDLSDKGHCIGAHTWDHQAVTKYEEKDWDIQLIRPKKQLENITGKSIYSFAYPYGVWNNYSIPKIKEYGYQMAFILSNKRDLDQPIYTIRRIIVSGSMSSEKMLQRIQSSFK